MDNMERAFLSTVRRRGLLPRGPVVAAVSGGADSICMLHLLHGFSRRMGWEVRVLHVDHGARPGSALDAGFVEEAAATLGLRFDLVRLRGGSGRGSPEAEFSTARQVAYERSAEGGPVAVAHTASDRAETLLMRLLEGTGLRGAGGMDYIGIGPVRRPMLDITRDQIRGWLSSKGLEWREDETNADAHYTRNRLRNEIMPLLERHFPGASRSLASSSANLSSWRRVADGLAECALSRASIPCNGGTSLDRTVFLTFEGALRTAIMWMLCGRPRAGAAELDRTDSWLAAGRTGRRLLPGGVVLEAGTAVLHFREADESERRRRRDPALL